jgi:lysophospholipase L1-like esterase
MMRSRFIGLVFFFALLGFSVAAPAACPYQRADVAAPKLGWDCKPLAGFINTHNRFVGIAKKNEAQVVFLGDSITALWWVHHRQHFQNEFGKYKAVNFGIGGDRTQHVLWRVQNGEFDGFKPKVAVLMIGTNNSGTNPPSEVAAGIRNIIKSIHQRSPNTKVLLHAIFPRGSFYANQQNAKVNSQIAKFHDGWRVHFLNINDRFLTANGSVSRVLMPDLLHLSADGYKVWANAIRWKLASLAR